MRHFRAVLYACAAITCAAQETINYASVSGRVADASEGVVAGASVTAREINTNRARTTVTDQEGRFRFAYLNVGPYEITVKRAGFTDQVRRLTLTVGAAYELPFVLQVGAAETNLTVTEDATVLEAARSQIAGTVSQTEVRNLPLNGRNFLDLALLVPGVSPTNTASNQLFAETSAVPGQGISVGSQRNFSNSFIVDGLSANDDAAGLSGIFYGLDVVQEFQVVTSGGQAELGRGLGGYISIVTKSGTNSTHGDVYGYLRNQRLGAANALSHNKLPMTQVQYGAGAGGPVVHDKTFYFANVERRELNQAGLVTISQGNIDAINARLAATGYPGPRLSTGLYASPVHNTNVLGKIDHQIRANDQLSVRYSLYNVDSHNSRGAGGLNAASSAANLDNLDQTLAVGNVATLSSRTVNETRGQFTNSSLRALPVDGLGPAVSISGVATFGTLSGSPTGRDNRLYELADNLSHHAGPHALRAGVDFLYNDSTITYPRSFRGSYTFSSLANFQSGLYNNSGFTQTFGNSVAALSNPNVGLYVQDEWKVRPSFTLNAGVRYDLQFLETIQTDRDNLSPRFGFAWSPGKDRKTVVRGGFGLFYDRVPLRALANALLSAGNTADLSRLNQIGVSLSPAQNNAPVFPNILAAPVPLVTLVNFSTIDRHMQNAYSEQGSIEVERQLGNGNTVSVGYQHLRGLHLIVSVNQNVPTCVASGSNNGCRPDASYANNSQYSSLADSKYDALNISFVRRPAKWGSVRVSYSYSKSTDNVGEFFFSSPIDPKNIWQDEGRSDDDQRHRVTVNGEVHTHGFQLSGMMQYYSALPLNITSGLTTVQGTTARPLVSGLFLARNAGTGFDFFSVGTRLSRTFRLSESVRLEAMAEGFNLMNHMNGVTKNANFGAGAYPSAPSPSFGQITAVGDPRTLQLALRIRF